MTPHHGRQVSASTNTCILYIRDIQTFSQPKGSARLSLSAYKHKYVTLKKNFTKKITYDIGQAVSGDFELGTT
jgi:hypothetical protein